MTSEAHRQYIIQGEDAIFATIADNAARQVAVDALAREAHERFCGTPWRTMAERSVSITQDALDRARKAMREVEREIERSKVQRKLDRAKLAKVKTRVKQAIKIDRKAQAKLAREQAKLARKAAKS